MLSKIVPAKQVEMLIRFGMVGLLTAAIYALILVLAVESVGQSAAVGVAIAYVVAVGFNYWAHYVWTYRTDQPHRSTGPRYVILVIMVFCINVIATAFLPEMLGVSYGIVQGLLAVIAAAITFAAQSAWVFSRGGHSL
jgi:putative flippase GtrA